MVAASNPHPLAVVTGGAGDLGSAIAAELRGAGYEVHAPGRDQLDVTSSASVSAFFAQLPRVDLVVHAAGICRDGLVLKMSDEDFARVLDASLHGAFRVCRAALKFMTRQRSGHLILISSFSAMSGPAGQTNYAAAKAGLIGLSQSLAREYGARNVRSNVILPGFMETKMTAGLPFATKRAALDAHVLGRFNTPAEVAAFVPFLDQKLPHTSGQVFNLDSRIHRWT
jgi:NAD(P)-dependent dehydrogenase (short-subunit alcohol dehydrogenase family)